MPPADIKILTLQEVAHKLGISYTQARVLILYDEKIPYFKVGSRGIRVKAEDLEKYITSTEQKKEEATSGSKDISTTRYPDTRQPYGGRGVLSGDTGGNLPAPSK